MGKEKVEPLSQDHREPITKRKSLTLERQTKIFNQGASRQIT